MKAVFLTLALHLSGRVIADDCSKTPYLSLDARELGLLRADLRSTVASVRDAITIQPRSPDNRRCRSGKKPPHKGPFGGFRDKGFTPCRFKRTLKAEDGFPLYHTAGVSGERIISDSPQEGGSLSESILRGWCVVLSNCASFTSGRTDGSSFSGLFGGKHPSSPPTTSEYQRRRDAVLGMLDSISSRGAITFYKMPPFSEHIAISSPAFPSQMPRQRQESPPENITVNAEIKWRGNILPSGSPRPEKFVTTYPYHDDHNARSLYLDSNLGTRRSLSSRAKRSALRSDAPEIFDGYRVSVRDDAKGDFCSPNDFTDWRILAKTLFTSVAHDRFANGASSIELNIMHSGLSGAHRIIEASQLRVRFWLSENADVDYQRLE